MKPDFNRCRETAELLLSQQRISGLRIRVRDLVFEKKIVFDTFQNYAKLTRTGLPPAFTGHDAVDGGTVIYNGAYIVLYDGRERNARRLNWTLAHEIGHIYLGHQKDSEIEQIEAHFFAAELLAPERALLDLEELNGSLTVRNVYDAFFLTWTAAQRRVETLRKRPCSANRSLLTGLFRPYAEEFAYDPYIPVMVPPLTRGVKSV